MNNVYLEHKVEYVVLSDHLWSRGGERKMEEF